MRYRDRKLSALAVALHGDGTDDVAHRKKDERVSGRSRRNQVEGSARDRAQTIASPTADRPSDEWSIGDRVLGRDATVASGRKQPSKGVEQVAPRQETGRVQPEAGRRGAGGRAIAVGALLFLGLTVFLSGVGRTGDDDAAVVVPEITATAGVAANFTGGGSGSSGPTREPDAQVAMVSAADFNGDGVPVVCLDPGHGGRDPGFVRPGDQMLATMDEASINLANGLDLARSLERYGVVVVLTRRGDEAVTADDDDVNGDGETFQSSLDGGASVVEANRVGDLDELQARIDVCNRADADLLVSMHINGFDGRADAKGYEAWFTGCREFGKRSERFATLAFVAIGDRLAAADLASQPRGLKNDCITDVDASDESLAHNMIVTGPELPGRIRPSQMPGAIIESLFISNDDDARILASAEGREAIVAAYEQAILAYFEDDEVGAP